MNFTETDEIEVLRAEIKDRFGLLPPEVVNLFNNLYLSIIAGKIFIKNISLSERGTKEDIKFTFDLEKLEEIENTETAITVQENLTREITEMNYDIRLENGGEKMIVEIPYGENRFEFTEKFIKILSK